MFAENLTNLTFQEFKTCLLTFRQLGQGAFGVVYRGYLSSGSEREIDVAVKVRVTCLINEDDLLFFDSVIYSDYSVLSVCLIVFISSV